LKNFLYYVIISYIKKSQLKEDVMKNKTLFDSIRCAFKGIFIGIKTEKNFKYYIAILVISLSLNLWADVSYIEYCILIMLSSAVFAAEYFNTAIEHISNILDPIYNYKIKIVKDISAGAVLIFGIAFIVVEAIILCANL